MGAGQALAAQLLRLCEATGVPNGLGALGLTAADAARLATLTLPIAIPHSWVVKLPATLIYFFWSTPSPKYKMLPIFWKYVCPAEDDLVKIDT